MQGQRSAIGSLPDSINLDYGSPTSNLNVDQQICWNNLRNPVETFTGSVSQEGRNITRWSFGESSSSNPQNVVSYDDRITQSGWYSSMNGSVSRLEEQRYEPTDFVSNTGFNLNISSNPVVAGPSLASHNNDLDDVNFHRVGNSVDPPNSSSKTIGSENKFTEGTSRTSGSLSEEDEGQPGCSVNVRRHSCKRKALEGHAGQSSSGGGCFSRSAEGVTWHVGPTHHDAGGSSSFSPTESVNPRLGLGIGGVPGDSLGPISTPGGQDTSQRSYRVRVNPSMQQDSVPNDSLSSAPSGARGPDISTSHQPLRFVPLSPPLDLMSSIPSSNSVPQSQPLILRVPTLRRNVQAHRSNGALNLRPGSSSSSTPSSERNTVLPEDLNSINPTRNITENLLFIPPVERRNSARTSTRWSASSGNVGASRNINSSNSNAPPGPSWAPHRHPSSQYSRRLSEYVRRSLLSTVGPENGGPRSNSQIRSSLQEGIPSSSGNQGQNARSALLIEREGDGALGMPYSLRALAAGGEGRSRLVSELRNVLDIMRRGEGLRLEDVMILDQSMFFGMADIHDQHRDMRLDVDNMSYEELLALEERIGNVCTGLSEDAILNRLKQHNYIHTMSDDHIDTEPCCICQEEYSDGEGIGTLDCGHDFHSECIKQWLAHKNLCPICKTTGLAT